MCSTTVPTGVAFIADAILHGMRRDDAVALDAVLAAADTRITTLIEAGRLEEAIAVSTEVEDDIATRFGLVYPTVAVGLAGSAS